MTLPSQVEELNSEGFSSRMAENSSRPLAMIRSLIDVSTTRTPLFDLAGVTV
jgi:hypothetical protein